MQITDLTEIEKLGLATSNLGPDNYTFSVRYKAISQNGQESISGGRTIKVVQSGTVEDASKEPCPKELWDTNEINKNKNHIAALRVSWSIGERIT